MTYRLENTLTYAFERCWSVAALKGTNNVAIGYDEGTICIQVRLTRTRTRTRTLTLTLTRTLARTLTLTRTLALTLTRTICIQMGNEDPMASMDGAGKVVLAKHNEISTLDVKKVEGQEVSDGERLVLPAKELDVCEIYPQWMAHNSNGRFAVVTGDGEYVIYTALAWRKKAFGVALDFVWAGDSGEYAVRENVSAIKIFKNFKEVS